MNEARPAVDWTLQLYKSTYAQQIVELLVRFLLLRPTLVLRSTRH